MTRLDAQFGGSDTFRVGVADFRGDGRPDYFYQAKPALFGHSYAGAPESCGRRDHAEWRWIRSGTAGERVHFANGNALG